MMITEKIRLKYREVFTLDNGFFKQLYQLYPDLYEQLFIDLSTDVLDYGCLQRFGQRYVSDFVQEMHELDSIPYVIASIAFTHTSKWAHIRQALDAKYDVTKPYNVTLTTNIEREFTSNTSADSIDSNIVYGFNDSVSGHKDNSNTLESSRDITNSENKSNVTTRMGNYANRSISEDITRELVMREREYLEIVMFDIKNDVCLTIY